MCLIDFRNFFTIYVFKIKESIADIPTELPCYGDLKSLGQLPVQEVLGRTDDCVLWIFTISSQGSSVGISVMDSLTLKAQIVKKL